MKDILIEFLESIREYEYQNEHSINDDERTTEEIVDTYLKEIIEK